MAHFDLMQGSGVKSNAKFRIYDAENIYFAVFRVQIGPEFAKLHLAQISTGHLANS